MLSLRELTARRNNGLGPRTYNGDCVFYRVYHNRSGDARTAQAVFVVSKDLLEKQRWIGGDLIDVLFDPETKQGALRRSAKAGWKLDCSKTGNSGHVRLTLPQGITMPAEALEDSIFTGVEGDKILFAFK